jgi:hypothetical protein
MKAGLYVRLQKVGTTPGGMPACPMPYYAPGAYRGYLSMPRDYWMDGVLVCDVRVGGQIHLQRKVRHGVVADGEFRSSPIIGVKDDLVATYNSVWRVQRVPPLAPTEDKERP